MSFFKTPEEKERIQKEMEVQEELDKKRAAEEEMAESHQRMKEHENAFLNFLDKKLMYAGSQKIICLEVSGAQDLQMALNYFLEKEFLCIQNEPLRYGYILTFVKKGFEYFFIAPKQTNYVKSS